jgi:hypothetical protein
LERERSLRENGLFGAWFGVCCWFRVCSRLVRVWSRLGFCVGVGGWSPDLGRSQDGPVYGCSPDWDGPKTALSGGACTRIRSTI